MGLRGFVRKLVVVTSSVAVALSAGVGARIARADDLTDRIEQTTRQYQEAEAEVERLEEQIAQNEERMAQIQEELPAQRERTAASIKSLYILQQSSPGLLELVLSAEDFNDFISTIRYIDVIHERNTAEVNALVDMEQELNQTQLALTADRDAAQQEAQEARDALEQARAAKQEAQARANQVAAAEATRRAEALEQVQQTVEQGTSKTAASSAAPTSTSSATDKSADQKDAKKDEQDSQDKQEEKQEDSQATITTKSGNTTVVEVAPEPSPSTEPIVENTTSSEVSSWASRIDAYLAGSPLAGYGSVFAQAASDYGVDPRLSPAIACVESGKGSVCFLPHNAWGWGSSSWSDWESAIRGHVSGFASIYGSTITLEGAEMYAGDDIYAEWYSIVLSEMASI